MPFFQICFCFLFFFLFERLWYKMDSANWMEFHPLSRALCTARGTDIFISTNLTRNMSSKVLPFPIICHYLQPTQGFLIIFWVFEGVYSVRNCAFLVANAAKNFALATRISQPVASRRLTISCHDNYTNNNFDFQPNRLNVWLAFRCKGKILLSLFGDHIFPYGDWKKNSSSQLAPA